MLPRYLSQAPLHWRLPLLGNFFFSIPDVDGYSHVCWTMVKYFSIPKYTSVPFPTWIPFFQKISKCLTSMPLVFLYHPVFRIFLTFRTRWLVTMAIPPSLVAEGEPNVHLIICQLFWYVVYQPLLIVEHTLSTWSAAIRISLLMTRRWHSLILQLEDNSINLDSD